MRYGEFSETDRATARLIVEAVNEREGLRAERDELKKRECPEHPGESLLCAWSSRKIEEEAASLRSAHEATKGEVSKLQRERATLLDLLYARRAHEPKHSQPDHECPECTALSDIPSRQERATLGGGN